MNINEIKIIFKKNLPYMLNMFYISIFSLFALYCVFSFFFPFYFRGYNGDELIILLVLFFGIFLFVMSIKIAEKTKLNWLRFGCLYFSGQIFAIIYLSMAALTLSMMLVFQDFSVWMLLINLMFFVIFLSILFLIIFWAIKTAQYVEVSITDISKIANIKAIIMRLSKKILPYTLSLLYVVFFLLLAISSINEMPTRPLKYDKYIHVSFFGVFLFTTAIIVAYKTKHKWLRFLSLYLLGQIYIVVVLIYVEVMNKFIIPR